MSAKPIDEFLQECTGWLEKIAAAKQREEAAYAAISNVQMEKKSFRTLARGAGHVARFVGGLASAPGRYLSRLGRRLINWGSKPKANNSLQNPLAKQVVAAKRNGSPQTKMVRTQDGTYKAQTKSTTTNTTGQQGGQKQQTNTTGQQGGQTTQPKPADPATPVKDPGKSTKTNATEQQGGQKQQTNPAEQPGGPQQQGGQLGAGNEAAMTQSDTFQKVMPYALAGGAGLLLGRSTAPAPVYMSPAMMHNNMMYQQMQQPIAPNIY